MYSTMNIMNTTCSVAIRMAHREEIPGLGQCSSGPDWDKQPENEWLAACTSAPEPEPSK